MGLNPEQTLARDAFTEGATTHKSQEDLENLQLQILSNQLKQLIRQRQQYKCTSGVAGPRGFEPLLFGFLPQKRPEACAPSREGSTP